MRRWAILFALVFVLLPASAAFAGGLAQTATPESFPPASTLTRAGSRPQEPHLALDARGALHAVWWDNAANGQVYARAQAQPGAAWGAEELLSAGEDAVLIESLRVVRNSQGEACAFWIGTQAGGMSLLMRCTSPSGWTPPQTVAPANGSIRGYAPAFASDGSVVATYLQGAGTIYFAGQQISDDVSLAGWHDFVVAPNGVYYAAWMEIYPGMGRSNAIWLRSSTDRGRTWSPQFQVSADENAPDSNVVLVADAQSRLHVAWIGSSSIYYRRLDAGGWGPVSEVNAGQGGVTTSTAGLQVDSRGAAHLVWEGSFVRYRIQQADGAWGDQLVIARGPTTGEGPALVVRPDGRRDILFRAADGQNDVALQYVSLAPDGTAAAATGPARLATVAVGDNFQSLPGIPLPNQISLDPKVIGVNLLLALLSSVYFGFVTSVFNGLLSAHTDEIGEWVQRLTPSRLRRDVAEVEERVPPAWQTLAFWLGIILVTSLIQSLLDPSPLFSSARLHVFLAITAAALIAAFVEKLSEIGVRTRLHAGRALRAEAYWYGIALAVVSVVFSRLMGFQPGYVVGIIGVLALLPEIEDGPRAGQRALGVLGSLLVFGLLCWVLSIPLAGAPDLQALALSVFVVCLQGVTFALIPLSIFDGSAIFKWRKGYWVAFFAVTAFLFYHILINPSMSDIGALQQNGLRTLLIVMAVYGLATLVLWIVLPFRLWLRERTRGKKPSPSG